MSKEEKQERFERIESILQQVVDLPEGPKSFIAGYMLRVNEEQGEKKKEAQLSSC